MTAIPCAHRKLIQSQRRTRYTVSGKEESQQTKKGQEKQISEKHVAAVAGLFLDREIVEIINNELYDFFLNSRGNGNFKIFLPKSGMASL